MRPDLLVIVTLLILPLASGHVIDDPIGDVRSSTDPAPPAPEFIDFDEVNISINASSLGLMFRMASTQAETPVFAPFGAEIALAFAFDMADYRVVLSFRQLQESDLQVEAELQQWGGAWVVATAYEVTSEPDGWRVEIPLADIEGPGGGTPGPGAALEFVDGYSWHDVTFTEYQGTVRYEDDLQFDSIVLQVPGKVHEGLAISVPEPIQRSNGQATTFHWPIQVQVDQPQDLVVSVDAPEHLDVHFPSSVQVQDEFVIDLYATTPFRHVHGAQDEIVLRLAGDLQETEVRVGIQYFDTPQPTGHHPEVFLHWHANPDEGVRRWMNTDQEPPSAEAGPINGGAVLCDGASVPGWVFPLEPNLVLGVDARIEEAAALQATVGGPVVDAVTTLRTALVLYDTALDEQGLPGEPSFDDAFEVTEMPWPAEESFTVDLALPLDPDLDWLPPQAERNLAIIIGRCAAGPDARLVSALDNVDGHWLEGGRLRLPLNEYADTLTFSSSGLEVTVEAPERHAAPGTTVLWEVLVDAETFSTDLFGADAAIATVHPASDGRLPVSAEVPEDAIVGDALSFIIEFKAGATTSAHQFIVIVDPASTADDAEAVAALQEGVKSPGFGAFGLVAMLVLLARYRR